ncbi:MAG: hypothetical protein ACLR8Y_16220 [Alistipes indistinctus]
MILTLWKCENELAYTGRRSRPSMPASFTALQRAGTSSFFHLFYEFVREITENLRRKMCGRRISDIDNCAPVKAA